MKMVEAHVQSKAGTGSKIESDSCLVQSDEAECSIACKTGKSSTATS